VNTDQHGKFSYQLWTEAILQIVDNLTKHLKTEETRADNLQSQLASYQKDYDKLKADYLEAIEDNQDMKERIQRLTASATTTVSYNDVVKAETPPTTFELSNQLPSSSDVLTNQEVTVNNQKSSNHQPRNEEPSNQHSTPFCEIKEEIEESDEPSMKPSVTMLGRIISESETLHHCTDLQIAYQVYNSKIQQQRVVSESQQHGPCNSKSIKPEEDCVKVVSIIVTDQHGIKTKVHQCSVCHKQFQSPASVRRHFHIHKLRCGVCDQSFVSMDNLKRHTERVHHGIRRPFPCRVCGKSFFQKTDLKKHVISHRTSL